MHEGVDASSPLKHGLHDALAVLGVGNVTREGQRISAFGLQLSSRGLRLFRAPPCAQRNRPTLFRQAQPNVAANARGTARYERQLSH
jgi:hypothetical protein